MNASHHTRESLRERCEVALRCLPQAPMRDRLARLFEELLALQDVRLPHDVKVGGNTFRKGVHLSTFILAAQHWHREAFPNAYTLTDAQKAANLARLQGAPHHRSAVGAPGSDKPEPDSGSSFAAQGMAQDAARMRKALDQAIDALDALTDKVDRTGFADSDAFAEALDAIDIGRAALRAVPHQPTGARK